MVTFELTPTDSRKSFYNKCRVEQIDNISTLISYSTKVAEYNHITNKMTVHGYYSPTTARHINAFLKCYGFDMCSKKELENYNK
jgi:hypothetical protein